eukprot:TRINITY_DN11641_c0_g1_i6.p1 TRINITY_DN11641_c0_g1~~TRINITY_DN11641_c0_g1_i6.p1  ORF type:complete len:162 (+),score=40.66 TRINITY_DN11641_c0_g1_i6:70-555(+)
MPWVALLLLAASAYPRDRTGCDRDESAGREFIARVRERPGARTFGCFDGAETCVVYEWLAQPQEGRVYRLSGTAPRARFAHNLTLWDGRARGSSDGSGVRDALRRMCFGDHWRLYLPHEQGYGDSGAGPGSGISGCQALQWDVKLLDAEDEFKEPCESGEL